MRSHNMYGFAEKYEKHYLDTWTDSKSVQGTVEPLFDTTIISWEILDKFGKFGIPYLL